MSVPPWPGLLRLPQRCRLWPWKRERGKGKKGKRDGLNSLDSGLGHSSNVGRAEKGEESLGGLGVIYPPLKMNSEGGGH